MEKDEKMLTARQVEEFKDRFAEAVKEETGTAPHIEKDDRSGSYIIYINVYGDDWMETETRMQIYYQESADDIKEMLEGLTDGGWGIDNDAKYYAEGWTAAEDDDNKYSPEEYDFRYEENLRTARGKLQCVSDTFDEIAKRGLEIIKDIKDRKMKTSRELFKKLKDLESDAVCAIMENCDRRNGRIDFPECVRIRRMQDFSDETYSMLVYAVEKSGEAYFLKAILEDYMDEQELNDILGGSKAETLDAHEGETDIELGTDDEISCTERLLILEQTEN